MFIVYVRINLQDSHCVVGVILHETAVAAFNHLDKLDAQYQKQRMRGAGYNREAKLQRVLQIVG